MTTHERSIKVRHSHGLVVALCVLGCVRNIPPPPIPAQTPVQLDPEPPPMTPGMGRVILETVDGPARVEAILGETSGSVYGTGGGASYYAASTRFLCVTPCYADMPYGAHELRFTGLRDESATTRRSREAITVGVRPRVVRHAVGRTTEHPALLFGGIIGVSVGGPLALSGGLLALLGHEGPGLPLLGTGGVLTIVGAVLLMIGRTDEQPGSTMTWEIGDYR